MVSGIKGSSSQSVHTHKKIQLPSTTTDLKTNKVSKSCFTKLIESLRNKMHSMLNGIGKCFKVIFCSDQDIDSSGDSLDSTTEKDFSESNSSSSTTTGENSSESSSSTEEEPKVDPTMEKTLERLKDIQESRLAKKAAAEARASGKAATTAGIIKQKEKKPPVVKLTPEEKKIAKDLKAKAKAEKQKKAEEKKRRELEKKKTKTRDEAIAALNNPIALSLKSPTSKVIGLKNITGANCYMNAAIQHLEINLADNKKFQDLLTQKLEKPAEESLSEFEERVLKDWVPLKQVAKESAKDFEDRILFKWSFLKLIQAKNFGASTNDITAALTTHHKICFGLRLHEDFYSGPASQKDSVEYHGMWCDVLQWHPLTKYDQTRAEVEVKDNETEVALEGEAGKEVKTLVYKHDKKLEVLNILRLPIKIHIKRRKLRKIQRQIKEFSTKKDIEIAELERKTEEEITKVRKNMPAKKAEKDEAPSQAKKLKAKRKAAEKKIDTLEKAKKTKIERLNRAKDEFADDLMGKAESSARLDGAKILADYFEDETIRGVKFWDKEKSEEITAPVATRENKLGRKTAKSFILQMQRFQGAKSHCAKLENKIDMTNMLTIDLRPYIKNPKDSDKTVYQMNGFVVHRGGYGAGHYISYVKKGKQWYECDDSTVKKFSEKELPLQDAYLCSYTRKRV